MARVEVTRRTILTLDDSSGATLDVVILQSDPKERTQAEAAQAQTSNATADQAEVMSLFDTSEGTTGIQYLQTTHLSATDKAILDISCLVPGTTVKVKGTLSTFRSVMQLQLERFTLVRDTNAEMQFVDERLQLLVEVLSVPWVLLDGEIEQLRRDAEQGDLEAVEERRRGERRARRRVQREERDQRHILKRYEREERRRAKEASACKADGARVMLDIQRRRGISERRSPAGTRG